MASIAIQPTEPVPAARITHWSFPLRCLFRFWFCYSLLYAIPTLFELVPGTEALAGFYTKASQEICIFVATHVFGVTGKAATYFPTGSGDTTLEYVRHFCLLVLSGSVCVIWSLSGRSPREYRELHAWLVVVVRYTLAVTLLSYGFMKVFPMQFQVPDVTRLIAPYGDFSPMGVLWAFVGASPAYTMFTGIVEVVGGALLLFRRTATLGAIVSAGALLNVFVLNMCYDVPVKLYSFNLLLMSVFLISPDMSRLANVLVLNRPTQPRSSSGIVFGKPYFRWAAVAAKVVVLGTILFSIVQTWQQYQTYIVKAKPSSLDGIWNVEAVTDSGQDRPPLATDSDRWWKVAITRTARMVAVRKMDDSLVRYSAKLDDAKNTLTLSEGNSPTNDNTPGVRYTFAVSQSPANQLTLSNARLVLELRRVDPKVYPLLNRGFHWINELPYNR